MPKLISMAKQQYNQVGVEPYFEIEEHCFEGTKSGHGKCLDRHTSEYEYCAERPTSDRKNRTEFCYYNAGNGRLNPNLANYDIIFGKEHGTILFNRYERKIPWDSKHWIHTAEAGVQSLCEPICRTQYGWDLPVMKPWKPTDHGFVRSRHQILTDIEDVPLEYGGGGEFPPDALTRMDWWEAGFHHQAWEPNPPWTWTSEALLLSWPPGGGNPTDRRYNYGYPMPRPPWNNQSLWDRALPHPPPPPTPTYPADEAWHHSHGEPWSTQSIH